MPRLYLQNSNPPLFLNEFDPSLALLVAGLASMELFAATTGCSDPGVARLYLDQAGNDVSRAINHYFDAPLFMTGTSHCWKVDIKARCLLMSIYVRRT